MPIVNDTTNWEKISKKIATSYYTWYPLSGFSNDIDDSAQMVGAKILEIRYREDNKTSSIFSPPTVWFLEFITDRGSFVMGHLQDCCEEVWLEDLGGYPLDELIGQYVYTAYRSESYNEDATWTYIGINACTFSWAGTSDGYYNESVYFQYYPPIYVKPAGEYVDIGLPKQPDKMMRWNSKGEWRLVPKTGWQHFRELSEKQLDAPSPIVAAYKNFYDDGVRPVHPHNPPFEVRFKRWRELLLQ